MDVPLHTEGVQLFGIILEEGVLTECEGEYNIEF